MPETRIERERRLAQIPRLDLLDKIAAAWANYNLALHDGRQPDADVFHDELSELLREINPD